MSEDITNGLLGIALSAAVPLRIMELNRLDPASRERVIARWAADAVEPVASRGDILMYRSKKSGATAEVFNHLAKGLAALACSPGGVTFQGQHWEARAAARPQPNQPAAPLIVVELPEDDVQPP